MLHFWFISWPYSKDKRNMVVENLEKIPEEFSFDKEKEIARSFSKRFQWEMILIGVGQATVWLSLWPLVINGYVSLLLGSLIGSPAKKHSSISLTPAAYLA